MIYDDGLQGIDLFRVLENYAQFYFIYSLNCPEIVSNYSIRWDYERKDEGNFPKWEMDCFKVKQRAEADRRFSKISNFDMFRLGRRMDEDSPYNDAFEFGAIAITEIGKERGNQYTKKSGGKDSGEVNQSNDNFNWDIKLGRHSATVEYSNFVKWLSDDQRPGDWEASGVDLCDTICIRKSSRKIELPFFAGEELLYQLFTPLFKKFYYNQRFKRGDNTLIGFILKSLYTKYSNYYLRRVNTYGVRVQNMQVKRQGENAEDAPKNEKYYVLFHKAFGRYRSDAYSGVFVAKAERSQYGLADLPEYTQDCATWTEYKAQNSFLIATIADAIVKEETKKEENPKTAKR